MSLSGTFFFSVMLSSARQDSCSHATRIASWIVSETLASLPRIFSDGCGWRRRRERRRDNGSDDVGWLALFPARVDVTAAKNVDAHSKTAKDFVGDDDAGVPDIK